MLLFAVKRSGSDSMLSNSEVCMHTICANSVLPGGCGHPGRGIGGHSRRSCMQKQWVQWLCFPCALAQAIDPLKVYTQMHAKDLLARCQMNFTSCLSLCDVDLWCWFFPRMRVWLHVPTSPAGARRSHSRLTSCCVYGYWRPHHDGTHLSQW